MRITLDGERFELTASSVRAALSGQSPEDIRQYWVDVDGVRWPVKQVISLATGVVDRQRFQSQSSRRWLDGLGFVMGGEGNRRSPSPTTSRRPTTRHTTSSATPGAAADVILVGCVKTKLGHGASAKDLYTSAYFTKMRTYAESTGLPWFILSAEHGLVRPDDWLEPYERYLPDTSRDYRSAWGEKVAEHLARVIGPFGGRAIEVHAGAAYLEAVEGPLQQRGAEVLDPLRGLTFGRRLSWYGQHESAGAPATAEAVVAQLRDEVSAMTLDRLRATGGTDLRVPGVYSWWVDEGGALDLSKGLGHPIGPGLIYAGLAGATRSGGSRSSNTLWGRITTMHLGTKHEFSTLRRSLGSILASAYRQPAIDEAQLTRWMHAHLRVVPVAYPDADSLDDLETALLAELDPPLNLAKMPKTPERRQLSALRKRYAGSGDGPR